MALEAGGSCRNSRSHSRNVLSADQEGRGGRRAAAERIRPKRSWPSSDRGRAISRSHSRNVLSADQERARRPLGSSSAPRTDAVDGPRASAAGAGCRGPIAATCGRRTRRGRGGRRAAAARPRPVPSWPRSGRLVAGSQGPIADSVVRRTRRGRDGRQAAAARPWTEPPAGPSKIARLSPVSRSHSRNGCVGGPGEGTAAVGQQQRARTEARGPRRSGVAGFRGPIAATCCRGDQERARRPSGSSSAPSTKPHGPRARGLAGLEVPAATCVSGGPGESTVAVGQQQRATDRSAMALVGCDQGAGTGRMGAAGIGTKISADLFRHASWISLAVASPLSGLNRPISCAANWLKWVKEHGETVEVRGRAIPVPESAASQVSAIKAWVPQTLNLAESQPKFN